MTNLAVETDGLCRRFGELEAVRNVNLRVEAGQFFGFLGPNGASEPAWKDLRAPARSPWVTPTQPKLFPEGEQLP